jgi:hypothetical protein
LVISDIDTPSDAPTGMSLNETSNAPLPTVDKIVISPVATTVTAFPFDSSNDDETTAPGRIPAVTVLLVVMRDEAPAAETPTATPPIATDDATAIACAVACWPVVASTVIGPDAVTVVEPVDPDAFDPMKADTLWDGSIRLTESPAANAIPTPPPDTDSDPEPTPV